MIHKNITEAMGELRPNDKIVRVLSNKFAVVKAQFTSGNYDKPCIMGLHNGKIYTYVMNVNHWQDKVKQVLARPNIEKYWVDFVEDGVYKVKIKKAKNTSYKKQYRKLEKLMLNV